jgi:small-conductance mechanosensitive channel
MCLAPASWGTHERFSQGTLNLHTSTGWAAAVNEGPGTQACLSDFEKFKQKMVDREGAMQQAANQQFTDATAKYEAVSERLADASAEVESVRARASQVSASAEAELRRVRASLLLHHHSKQSKQRGSMMPTREGTLCNHAARMTFCDKGYYKVATPAGKGGD